MPKAHHARPRPVGLRRWTAGGLTAGSAVLAVGASALLATRFVPPRVLPVRADTWAMVTAFTDFAAPGYVLAALTAAGAVGVGRGRTRVVLATACAAGAVVPLLLLAPRWVADPPPSSQGSFTVLALNNRLGRADPEALVGAAQAADVLVLTEVTEPQVRALEAAGITGRFPYRTAGRLPATGASGTAVLSRFPVTGTRPLADLINQSWVCEIALPGLDRPLTVVAAHPTRPRTGGTHWLPEQEELRAALPTTGPRLLAGDFNAVASHPTQREIVRDGWASAVDQAGAGWVPTYPADSRRLPPVIDIDHVYLADGLHAGRVRSVAVPGTDHRGLLVSVGLATGT